MQLVTMHKGIIHSILALVLVLANLGLTLSTHYCQGEAFKTQISLGRTDMGCGMLCDFSAIIDNNGTNIGQSPCCQNEYQILYVTDNYVKDAARFSLNIDFTFAIIYSTLNSDIVPKPTYPFYTSYIPPPLKKDFRVLFQTFII